MNRDTSKGKWRGAVIVGAGTMGITVAACFLLQGWHVQIVEPACAVRARIFESLKSLLAADEAVPMLESCVDILPDVASVDWRSVEIVSENAPEKLDIKRSVFATLSQCAPNHIILSSNSSTLAMASIAQGLTDRARMLGIHFLMPAHRVPLAEVLDTGGTDPGVVSRAIDILESLDKKPVRLKKDIPGFLANRIQAALMREAWSLVEEGVASPEDVDAAVRYGFGFRYAACGPFLQKEHSGWDISHKVYLSVYPSLCNDANPSPSLDSLVKAGEVGMKAGRGLIDWTEEDMRRERARFKHAMKQAEAIVRDATEENCLNWRPKA